MVGGWDTHGPDNAALKQLILTISEFVISALHFLLTGHAAGGANTLFFIRFCFYGLSGNADLLFSIMKHFQIG